MATTALGRLVAGDELRPPPPQGADERRAAEDLLRRVDEAIATLRREAIGLSNAREQYRRRMDGTRR